MDACSSAPPGTGVMLGGQPRRATLREDPLAGPVMRHGRRAMSHSGPDEADLRMASGTSAGEEESRRRWLRRATAEDALGLLIPWPLSMTTTPLRGLALRSVDNRAGQRRCASSHVEQGVGGVRAGHQSHVRSGGFGLRRGPAAGLVQPPARPTRRHELFGGCVALRGTVLRRHELRGGCDVLHGGSIAACASSVAAVGPTRELCGELRFYIGSALIICVGIWR